MQFSQRMGLSPVRQELQVDSIGPRLKNKLWNLIYRIIHNLTNTNAPDRVSVRQSACQYIWVEFFAHPIDELPRTSRSRASISCDHVVHSIKDWFFEAEWYEIYDFVEFIVGLGRKLKSDYSKSFNVVLNNELAGYRIIENMVVPVTSEEEVSEIEEAVSNTSIWTPVTQHLSASLQHFSNRENPDYRNSVKESISAVESLCKIIAEDKNATLGVALAMVERKLKIHSALKSAFKSLYGYTSDSGGIRHALLEDDVPVTMEDAKFMLVSCSAFINYLKVKLNSNSGQ